MNCIANRIDIDEIYALKENFHISLKGDEMKLNSVIDTIKSESYLSLDIQFHNNTKENYNIVKVRLRIKMDKEFVVLEDCKETIGQINSSDRYFINKNNPLIIPQKSTYFRFLNFRVNQDFIKKIKQLGVDSVEIVVNEGKDEKGYKLK